MKMGQYQRESGSHMVLESVLAAVVGIGGQPVQVDPAVAITHTHTIFLFLCLL